MLQVVGDQQRDLSQMFSCKIMLEWNFPSQIFEHQQRDSLQLLEVELEIQSWTSAFQLEHQSFDCVPFTL